MVVRRIRRRVPMLATGKVDKAELQALIRSQGTTATT